VSITDPVPTNRSPRQRNRPADWFNAVDQHRHRVNKMATLLLLATSGFSAREVPLLYGPVLVASHDALGAPAGLSGDQIRTLVEARKSHRPTS
jgi:hypothetical protein